MLPDDTFDENAVSTEVGPQTNRRAGNFPQPRSDQILKGGLSEPYGGEVMTEFGEGGVWDFGLFL